MGSRKLGSAFANNSKGLRSSCPSHRQTDFKAAALDSPLRKERERERERARKERERERDT